MSAGFFGGAGSIGSRIQQLMPELFNTSNRNASRTQGFTPPRNRQMSSPSSTIGSMFGSSGGFRGNTFGGMSFGRSNTMGSFGTPGRNPLFMNNPGKTPENEWGQTLFQHSMGGVGGGPDEGWAGGDASQARGLEGTKQWDSYIKEAAAESGVPWQVISAIMGIESGGRNGGVSPAGAVGLMQIMPNYWQDTANAYGGDLNDPRTNIRTGAAILKHYYDQYGSWEAAAGAYLAGSPFSTARDAYGTGVSDYQRLFNANLAALGWGNNTPTGVPPSVSNPTGRPWSERTNPNWRPESTNTGFAGTGVSWSGEAVTTEAGNAIDIASQFIGMPYVYGGASPSTSFDCSGLTQYSFAQAGKQLPRTAQAQFDSTMRIDATQAQPGDLVFFHSTYDNPRGEYITHVGIYLGNGKMLHAGGSSGTSIADLNTDYWQRHMAGYGRVR